MPDHDITIKTIEPQTVAAVREVVPTPQDIGKLFGELFGYVMSQAGRPTGPAFSIYYDQESRERDVDVEVAVPIDRSLPGGGRVTSRQLPEVQAMACLIHRGGYDRLGDAYMALLSWIQSNAYSISGPGREIYIKGPEPGRPVDPATFVTELQFPVHRP